MKEHAPGKVARPRAACEHEDWTARTDAELAGAVRDLPWEQGGNEAFWTLWLRYEKPIWRAVRRLSFRFCPRNVQREVFAEALLERVQLKLVRGVGQYHGPAPLGAFLTTAVTRSAMDQYRYYRARPWETTAPASDFDADANPGDSGTPYRVPSFPGPDKVVAAKERKAVLHEALRLVAKRSNTAVHWAAALRRHYLEDQDGGEIARQMDCTPDAVHKYLERGRRELKAVLAATFGIARIEDLL